MKLQWATGTWTEQEKLDARKALTDAMLKHRKAMRSTGSKVQTTPVGCRNITVQSAPVRAHVRGHAKMNALARSLSEGSLDSSPPSPSGNTSTDLTESQLDADDILAVNEELKRWIADGIMTKEEEIDELDLVTFWQCFKHEFPLLYRVVLDILPAQASAVPCERVFSSGKETDTHRRSRLDSDMMEKLQILKYSIRANHLDFTQGLLATEAECTTVIDLDTSIIGELIMTGDIDELESLINMSQY